MKKRYIFFILISILILSLSLYIWYNSKPLTESKASSLIEDVLKKEIVKNKSATQGLIYIHSGKTNYEQSFSYSKNESQPIDSSLPFHVASVGKAFTATLVGILMDRHQVSLDDKISTYLTPDELKGLFIYEGVDYSDEVTLGQLLSHTSGVADYFEDAATGSPTLIELVLTDSTHFWTPENLLDFSRNYQKAIGRPGDSYHYSDTGYILLGLCLEKVSKKSFATLLQEEIFAPLNMNDSYLMFYGEPKNEPRPIADIWLQSENIKKYQSLSIDWSGGGIISTLNDLAIFVKALNTNEIISESTLNQLYSFDQRFMTGIHYGYGFMEYHFDEFFPTLGFLPNLRGHMGILGTQMLYDKESDIIYISSLGTTDAPDASVKMMIKILTILSRIKSASRSNLVT